MIHYDYRIDEIPSRNTYDKFFIRDIIRNLFSAHKSAIIFEPERLTVNAPCTPTVSSVFPSADAYARVFPISLRGGVEPSRGKPRTHPRHVRELIDARIRVRRYTARGTRLRTNTYERNDNDNGKTNDRARCVPRRERHRAMLEKVRIS